MLDCNVAWFACLRSDYVQRRVWKAGRRNQDAWVFEGSGGGGSDARNLQGVAVDISNGPQIGIQLQGDRCKQDSAFPHHFLRPGTPAGNKGAIEVGCLLT